MLRDTAAYGGFLAAARPSAAGFRCPRLPGKKRSRKVKATFQPLPSFSAGSTSAMLSTFSKP